MSESISSQLLLQQLEKLTNRLSEIVARDFTSLSAEQLNWKPNSDRWSIAECLLHLNYFSKYYFPATKNGIVQAQKRKTKPNTTFKSSWWGNRMVEGVQLLPSNQAKKLLECPIKYDPTFQDASQIDGHQIVNVFLENQTALLEMLVTAKEVNIQKTKISVAFYGFLSIPLGNMFQYIIYHNERHIVQAQRVHYHDHFPGNTPLSSLFEQE